MLLCQRAAEGLAAFVNRAAEDDAVRAREIHMLENTLLVRLFRREVDGFNAGARDAHHFARLDLAHILRVEQIESTSLGGHQPGVTEPAKIQGAKSARVAHRDSSSVVSTSSEYAPVDPRGFRPLNLGRLGDAWLVASETCAFDLLNAQYVREVEPGEMVRISPPALNPSTSRRKSRTSNVFSSMCISRARTASSSAARLTKAARPSAARWQRSIPPNADIVVPVPDSGVPAAVGYALESAFPSAWA